MTIIISSERFLVIDVDLLVVTIRSMINSIIYININIMVINIKWCYILVVIKKLIGTQYK